MAELTESEQHKDTLIGRLQKTKVRVYLLCLKSIFMGPAVCGLLRQYHIMQIMFLEVGVINQGSSEIRTREVNLKG